MNMSINQFKRPLMGLLKAFFVIFAYIFIAGVLVQYGVGLVGVLLLTVLVIALATVYQVKRQSRKELEDRVEALEAERDKE